jgi:hypothetical protein
MVEVPGIMPVATPVDDPMVATLRLPLVHVPPVAASVSDVVKPVQMLSEPPIAGGAAFTVTSAVTLQPVADILYVMRDVPVAIPETTPVEVPIDATVVLLLLHVPPGVPSVSDVLPPTHIARLPVIGAGSGLTVTTTQREQPVPVV